MWHGGVAGKVVATMCFGAIVGSAGLAAAGRQEARVDTVRSTIVRHEDNRRPSIPPTPRTGTSQTIAVTVPNIAVLRLDHRGRIVAAATNTGRAPLPGDLVYVVAADGSYRPTDVDLTGRPWTGDFSRSMRFQRQRMSAHHD